MQVKGIKDEYPPSAPQATLHENSFVFNEDHSPIVTSFGNLVILTLPGGFYNNIDRKLEIPHIGTAHLHHEYKGFLRLDLKGETYNFDFDALVRKWTKEYQSRQDAPLTNLTHSLQKGRYTVTLHVTRCRAIIIKKADSPLSDTLRILGLDYFLTIQPKT